MDASQPMHTIYDAALNALLEQVPTVHSAVLAQTDGFEVAKVTRGDVPAARVAALASSMVALGDAALRELGLDGGGNVLIEGRNGKLLLLEVPQPARPLVLAVVASESAVTGALLWSARECVREISEAAVAA